jgi:C4-dicarboxylate-specific signal transduction histidine kinase
LYDFQDHIPTFRTPLLLVLDNRRELVDALSTGFRVIHRKCGDGVLDVAMEFQPAVIVLGDAMPGAAEICCRLQSGTRIAPLIAISMEKDDRWLESMVEAGIDDLLLWPFSAGELEIRITKIIGNFRHLSDLGRKNKLLCEALRELKEFEANLVQSEKLSQLGEMIAGIVHEINNPLNYSHSGLYVLRELAQGMDERSRAEFGEILADVTEGLDRVNHIVRDLRNFASRSRTQNSSISLAAAVGTATRLLGHKLACLDVLIDVPEQLLVFGNENKYCQVIVNLIKNGVEATEDAARGLENSRIRIVGREAAGGVELRIRDNGCGIPAEELGSVFNAFFSTKNSGDGMGLGLGICRRIMEEQGGSISVESEVGCHTEFILLFPKPPSESASIDGAVDHIKW